jgi:hypothetical protein
MSKIVEHPVAFAALSATSLVVAYMLCPRVVALWRSVSVMLGLSNKPKDKIFTYITQHSKNMLEAEKNRSYAFSLITCPALISGSHRVAVGILPNDSLLADIRGSSLCKGQDGASRQLAVLSVVEQFELDTEFDYVLVFSQPLPIPLSPNPSSPNPSSPNPSSPNPSSPNPPSLSLLLSFGFPLLQFLIWPAAALQIFRLKLRRLQGTLCLPLRRLLRRTAAGTA